MEENNCCTCNQLGNAKRKDEPENVGGGGGSEAGEQVVYVSVMERKGAKGKKRRLIIKNWAKSRFSCKVERKRITLMIEKKKKQHSD